MLVLFGTKCIWKKKRILSKTKVVCNTKHAFALRLRVQMFIMILKCICSNVPKNLLIICPHPPLTPPSPLNRTVFTQRLVSEHVYEVNMAIATWSPFLSIRMSKYQRDIAAKMKQLCYLICTSHSSRSLSGTGYFLRWNRRGEFEH